MNMKRLALTITTLLLVPLQTGAAVYKCKTADGKLIYQQQPCPESMEQSRIDYGKNEWILIKTEYVHDTGPNGKKLAWFEKTYMKEKVERIEHLKRASFRTISSESAHDRPTPDQTRFARVSYYYYDCALGKIAGGIPGGIIGGYDFLSEYESESIVHKRLLGPNAEKYFFQPAEYNTGAGHPEARRRVCGDS